MTFRAWALLLLLALSLLSSTTSAQSEADKTTARNLYVEGKTAFDAKDFVKAADLFKRSNELYPAPTAALGQARSLREAGQWVQAYEAYNSIVRTGAAEDAVDAFKNAVESAKLERGKLEPRLPSVVITVDCDCAPQVTLDGVDVPAAALGVKRFVNPGQSQISVTADGYKPSETTVSVEEGNVRDVNVVLEKLPEGAKVPVPPTPTPTPTPTPEPETPVGDDGSGMRAAGIALGVVGLASLVVAGITGGIYLSNKSEVEEMCPNQMCPTGELVDTADAGQTMGLVNTITLPVGVAALGAGILVYLLAPSSDEVALVPMLGPNNAGLTMRGSF